jgi:hypothetical protein
MDVGGDRRTRLPGLSRIDAAVELRAIRKTNGSAVLTDHHLRFHRDRRGQARYGGQTASWRSLELWARAAFATGKYHEAELTAEIVYIAQRLYAIAERGDRLIAATAATLDLPLITRDLQIAAAAGVECLWA